MPVAFAGLDFEPHSTPRAPLGPCRILVDLAQALFKDKAELAAENLALRQQLAVQQRRTKRPKLRPRDRIFWVWLSRIWGRWRSALLIVRPETVVGWHRQGFRLYWAPKSRKGHKPGRPQIDSEVRDLIRRMSRENPTWGVPRIRAELALLGESRIARLQGKVGCVQA